MKNLLTLIAIGTAVCLPLSVTARADVQIASFDEGFFEDAVYASWALPSATIVYAPTSYNVTATGYGSNWTYIGALAIQGAGSTHIKLDVTLEGPPAAEANLGPIITLVDSDGTRNNYAWFGQLLGNNILTLPITSPTWVEAPGTTPGLNLNAIDHLHLQIDPGQFGASAPYTVRWNNLSLFTQAGVPGDFNSDSHVDGKDFLVWQRGGSPTALSPADLATWKANYGTGAVAPVVAAVPEPATLGLLAIAGFGLCGMARTKRSAR
jgi:hypothetical protein